MEDTMIILIYAMSGVCVALIVALLIQESHIYSFKQFRDEIQKKKKPKINPSRQTELWPFTKNETIQRFKIGKGRN